MTNTPPAPPAGSPDDVVERLDACSPDQLRELARYAEALADHREHEAQSSEGDDGDDRPPREHDDPPDSVPPKATLTTKEINGNRYHYWQWREGDRIRSEYEGPVSPDG